LCISWINKRHWFVNAQGVSVRPPGKHRLIAMQVIASENDGGTIMGSGNFEYAAEKIFNLFLIGIISFQRTRCFVNK
jgi:hypothetical protein